MSDDQIAMVRILRNAQLASCDWTQGADSPLSSDVKASWATYRQALRNVPQNQDLSSLSDMSQVNWPSEPA